MHKGAHSSPALCCSDGRAGTADPCASQDRNLQLQEAKAALSITCHTKVCSRPLGISFLQHRLKQVVLGLSRFCCTAFAAVRWGSRLRAVGQRNFCASWDWRFSCYRGTGGECCEARCYGELPSHAGGSVLDLPSQRDVCWDTNSTARCTISGSFPPQFCKHRIYSFI